MKIAMICYSLTGFQTAERLETCLKKEGHEIRLDAKSKYLENSIKESTGKWAGERFEDSDAIIFVGACGIAVRSIAPYVTGKKVDPAVLVIDECGKFVISLLSGHLGGANELSLKCAEFLSAVPVVTTATDLHQRFAVDVFAKKNGCSIFYMKAAKEVSAALLAGECVGFYSDFLQTEKKLPKGLIFCDREGRIIEGTDKGKKLSLGVAVTIYKDCMPFVSTVHVVPKTVTIGVGCRRGKEKEFILEEIEGCVQQLNIYREAIEKLCSIDLKKEEEGILAVSAAWNIPFETFSEEELLAVQGDFTPSAFVKKITGVDNVCERSAVLGSKNGTLLKRKIGRNGVTTAAARKEWRMHFE